jgi:hypothetical protein
VDGFVLILAIIVFSVFRNVIAEAKKKQERRLPDVLDSIAEHDEAQDRALDALRQWEARQQPAAGREPRPYDLERSQGAERTRREAYDAIRELLSEKADRPAAQVPARTDPVRRQVSAPHQSEVPARIRERVPEVRPRIRGTVQPRIEPTDPISPSPGAGRRTEGSLPAGLDRLESLPPVARGLLYAELLGKPVAFRGPGEDERD